MGGLDKTTYNSPETSLIEKANQLNIIGHVEKSLFWLFMFNKDRDRLCQVLFDIFVYI